MRDGRVLLVASCYPDRKEPLWNLPGGRARPAELLHAALIREFDEEVGLRIDVGELAYVAESYDPIGHVHVTSTVFVVASDGEPRATSDPAIVGRAWVTRAELTDRIGVAVVRDPLLTHLDGGAERYFAYADAGISITPGSEP